MRHLHRRKDWHNFIAAALVILLSVMPSVTVQALEQGTEAEEAEADQQLLLQYQDYQERLMSVEKRWEIAENGFQVIEDQIFLMETGPFANVSLVPALEPQYHRLVLFWVEEDGTVIYKTDQLAANAWNTGNLEQPIRSIAAVSFQDLNRDGREDIVLICSCRNQTGFYAGKDYKIGDVLFQKEDGFYRDYRLSDKVNRFGMNKTAEMITAYVRDGYSTEFLYTASTKDELLRNGFEISANLDYSRQFEKLGYLEVMPGTYSMADFSTLMIYLINEQGEIVWSFQPMGDFDNLYALRGITCRDIDGDGMKDILILARYSYEGDEVITESDYQIYYQRTNGFETDTEVKKKVPCGDEATVADLVEKARAYWGWSPET